MSIFDEKTNIVTEEYLLNHGYTKCKNQVAYFKDLNTVAIHIMGAWCYYNIGIVYSPTSITIVDANYAFSYRSYDLQNIDNSYTTLYNTNFHAIDEFTLEFIEHMFSKDEYEQSEWLETCNYKFI